MGCTDSRPAQNGTTDKDASAPTVVPPPATTDKDNCADTVISGHSKAYLLSFSVYSLILVSWTGKKEGEAPVVEGTGAQSDGHHVDECKETSVEEFEAAPNPPEKPIEVPMVPKVEEPPAIPKATEEMPEGTVTTQTTTQTAVPESVQESVQESVEVRPTEPAAT
jgi:hypothetical protein